jgi:membrane-bound ClpP family serine protease
MMTMRLITAVISTAIQEVALWVIWRWGLPELGVYLPLWVLVVVMFIWGTYAMATFLLVTKALRRKEIIGLPMMVGGKGRAVSRLAPEGQVVVSGELWNARAAEGVIENNTEVLVVAQDGLKLIVREVSADSEGQR